MGPPPGVALLGRPAPAAGSSPKRQDDLWPQRVPPGVRYTPAPRMTNVSLKGNCEYRALSSINVP